MTPNKLKKHFKSLQQAAFGQKRNLQRQSSLTKIVEDDSGNQQPFKLSGLLSLRPELFGTEPEPDEQRNFTFVPSTEDDLRTKSVNFDLFSKRRVQNKLAKNPATEIKHPPLHPSKLK